MPCTPYYSDFSVEGEWKTRSHNDTGSELDRGREIKTRHAQTRAHATSSDNKPGPWLRETEENAHFGLIFGDGRLTPDTRRGSILLGANFHDFFLQDKQKFTNNQR